MMSEASRTKHPPPTPRNSLPVITQSNTVSVVLSTNRPPPPGSVGKVPQTPGVPPPFVNVSPSMRDPFVFEPATLTALAVPPPSMIVTSGPPVPMISSRLLLSEIDLYGVAAEPFPGGAAWESTYQTFWAEAEADRTRRASRAKRMLRSKVTGAPAWQPSSTPPPQSDGSGGRGILGNAPRPHRQPAGLRWRRDLGPSGPSATGKP